MSVRRAAVPGAPMRGPIALIVLVLLAAVAAAPVLGARQRTLRVIASNGIKEALESLIPVYERSAGVRVSVEWGASAVLRRSIESGAPFDVAILTPAVIDGLLKGGKLAEGTRADLARSDLAIGMRAGGTKDDIATPAALKRRLLAARSVTYASEGAATGTFNDMMARLGITDAMRSRIVLQPPSRRPADVVAAGEQELVFAPVSELLHVPNLEVLGVFPAEFQQPLVMTGAIGAASTERAAAAALLELLGGPAATEYLKAAGMEPVSGRQARP